MSYKQFALITAEDQNILYQIIQEIYGQGFGDHGYGQHLTTNATYAIIHPFTNWPHVASLAQPNQIIDWWRWAQMSAATDITSLHTGHGNPSPPQYLFMPGNLIIPEVKSDTHAIVDWQQSLYDIFTNRLQYQSESVSIFGPVLSSLRARPWSDTIEHSFKVHFKDDDSARYFFNSGGEIRMQAEHVSFNLDPQDQFWSVFLSKIGVIRFSAITTTSSAAVDKIGNSFQIGYYQLSSDWQKVYEAYGSDVLNAFQNTTHRFYHGGLFEEIHTLEQEHTHHHSEDISARTITYTEPSLITITSNSCITIEPLPCGRVRTQIPCTDCPPPIIGGDLNQEIYNVKVSVTSIDFMKEYCSDRSQPYPGWYRVVTCDSQIDDGGCYTKCSSGPTKTPKTSYVLSVFMNDTLLFRSSCGGGPFRFSYYYDPATCPAQREHDPMHDYFTITLASCMMTTPSPTPSTAAPTTTPAPTTGSTPTTTAAPTPTPKPTKPFVPKPAPMDVHLYICCPSFRGEICCPPPIQDCCHGCKSVTNDLLHLYIPDSQPSWNSFQNSLAIWGSTTNGKYPWHWGDPYCIIFKANLMLSGGKYDFVASVDDEARIYIDGKQVYQLQSSFDTTAETFSLNLAGGSHVLELSVRNEAPGWLGDTTNPAGIAMQIYENGHYLCDTRNLGTSIKDLEVHRGLWPYEYLTGTYYEGFQNGCYTSVDHIGSERPGYDDYHMWFIEWCINAVSLYDDQGNVLQMQTPGGNFIVYLWAVPNSPNSHTPIIKINGQEVSFDMELAQGGLGPPPAGCTQTNADPYGTGSTPVGDCYPRPELYTKTFPSEFLGYFCYDAYKITIPYNPNTVAASGNPYYNYLTFNLTYSDTECYAGQRNGCTGGFNTWCFAAWLCCPDGNCQIGDCTFKCATCVDTYIAQQPLTVTNPSDVPNFTESWRVGDDACDNFNLCTIYIPYYVLNGNVKVIIKLNDAPYWENDAVNGQGTLAIPFNPPPTTGTGTTEDATAVPEGGDIFWCNKVTLIVDQIDSYGYYFQYYCPSITNPPPITLTPRPTGTSIPTGTPTPTSTSTGTGTSTPTPTQTGTPIITGSTTVPPTTSGTTSPPGTTTTTTAAPLTTPPPNLCGTPCPVATEINNQDASCYPNVISCLTNNETNNEVYLVGSNLWPQPYIIMQSVKGYYYVHYDVGETSGAEGLVFYVLINNILVYKTDCLTAHGIFYFHYNPDDPSYINHRLSGDSIIGSLLTSTEDCLVIIPCVCNYNTNLSTVNTDYCGCISTTTWSWRMSCNAGKAQNDGLTNNGGGFLWQYTLSLAEPPDVGDGIATPPAADEEPTVLPAQRPAKVNNFDQTWAIPVNACANMTACQTCDIRFDYTVTSGHIQIILELDSATIYEADALTGHGFVTLAYNPSPPANGAQCNIIRYIINQVDSTGYLSNFWCPPSDNNGDCNCSDGLYISSTDDVYEYTTCLHRTGSVITDDGYFGLNYNAYDIADTFEIWVNGVKVATSGQVTETTGSPLLFHYSKTDPNLPAPNNSYCNVTDIVTIRVVGSVSGNTWWDGYVVCPGESQPVQSSSMPPQPAPYNPALLRECTFLPSWQENAIPSCTMADADTLYIRNYPEVAQYIEPPEGTGGPYANAWEFHIHNPSTRVHCYELEQIGPGGGGPSAVGGGYTLCPAGPTINSGGAIITFIDYTLPHGSAPPVDSKGQSIVTVDYDMYLTPDSLNVWSNDTQVFMSSGTSPVRFRGRIQGVYPTNLGPIPDPYHYPNEDTVTVVVTAFLLFGNSDWKYKLYCPSDTLPAPPVQPANVCGTGLTYSVSSPGTLTTTHYMGPDDGVYQIYYSFIQPLTSGSQGIDGTITVTYNGVSGSVDVNGQGTLDASYKNDGSNFNVTIKISSTSTGNPSAPANPTLSYALGCPGGITVPQPSVPTCPASACGPAPNPNTCCSTSTIISSSNTILIDDYYTYTATISGPNCIATGTSQNYTVSITVDPDDGYEESVNRGYPQLYINGQFTENFRGPTNVYGPWTVSLSNNQLAKNNCIISDLTALIVITDANGDNQSFSVDLIVNNANNQFQLCKNYVPISVDSIGVFTYNHYLGPITGLSDSTLYISYYVGSPNGVGVIIHINDTILDSRELTGEGIYEYPYQPTGGIFYIQYTIITTDADIFTYQIPCPGVLVPLDRFNCCTDYTTIATDTDSQPPLSIQLNVPLCASDPSYQNGWAEVVITNPNGITASEIDTVTFTVGETPFNLGYTINQIDADNVSYTAHMSTDELIGNCNAQTITVQVVLKQSYGGNILSASVVTNGSPTQNLQRRAMFGPKILTVDAKPIDLISTESGILDNQHDQHVISKKYSIKFSGESRNTLTYDIEQKPQYWYPDKELIMKAADIALDKKTDEHAGSVILDKPVSNLTKEEILKAVGMDEQTEYHSDFKVFSMSLPKYDKITQVQKLDSSKDDHLISVLSTKEMDDVSLLAIITVEKSGHFLLEYLCDSVVAFFMNGILITETTPSDKWQVAPVELTNGRIFFEIREKQITNKSGEFGFRLKDMNGNIIASSKDIDRLIIPPYVCPNGFVPDLPPFTNGVELYKDKCPCRNRQFEFNMKMLEQTLNDDKLKKCISGSTTENSWTTKLNLKTKVVASRQEINGGSSLLEYHSMVLNIIQMMFDILVNGMDTNLLVKNPVLILKTCRKYGIYANIEGQKVCHDSCNSDVILRQIMKQILTILDV